MDLFLLLLVGSCLGSFLNVVIERLNQGEGILRPRSSCESCHHKLAFFDLIPIFSWLALGGRCRYCHSPIPWQYPLVELATGILFLLVYQEILGNIREYQGINQFIGLLAYWLIITSFLIIIFVSDLLYQIVPDKIVYPAIALAIFYSVFSIPALPAGRQYSVFNYLLSGLGATGFFFLLHLLTRGKGMGLGDVKLAGLMGLILGVPQIILAFYLAFLTGAFSGVILILLKKKKFKEEIAFGPFLVGATFITLFWGEKILLVVENLFL